MMALDIPIETSGMSRLATWLSSLETPMLWTSRMA